MKILENVSMSEYTSFHIGGKAKYFCVAKNNDDFRFAINFAKEKKIKYFALGEGSNVLVSDYGFDGIVIKNETKGISFLKQCCKKIKVTVKSGEILDDVIKKTIEKGYFGLEMMSGIPGTVGAAVYGNVGAYGKEIKDLVFSVEIMDPETGTLKILSNKECFFGYRDSIFKSDNFKKNIITEVSFILRTDFHYDVLYKDIDEYFKLNSKLEINPVSTREAVLYVRKNKLPDWRNSDIGTAGSFWKNPVLKLDEYEKLKNKYSEIPAFSSGLVASGSVPKYVKVPLAWILDKVCNLKGYKIGNVGLYEKQPLVVVSLGEVSSEEVKKMADFVASEVYLKTGIKIEREVEYL